MSDGNLIWVICYDIRDDRRRRKIAEILEETAVRVQGSVFEFRGARTDIKKLVQDLMAYLATEDSLRAYPLPVTSLGDCIFRGATPVTEETEFWLI